jgi:myo-inositol 2-dehydrogenase/D-chiro-inositol 1-dehydrogenase
VWDKKIAWQIHDFDMAHFIVGAEVEEVYTYASCRVDPAIGAAGDVDTSLVMLKFANGAVATVDNCRKATYGYDQVWKLFSSRYLLTLINCSEGGSIRVEGNDSDRQSFPQSVHSI